MVTFHVHYVELKAVNFLLIFLCSISFVNLVPDRDRIYFLSCNGINWWWISYRDLV